MGFFARGGKSLEGAISPEKWADFHSASRFRRTVTKTQHIGEQAGSDTAPAAAAISEHPLVTHSGVYNVLIFCTGNSARSIMAEAILNKLGAGKFRAFSAGSQPKGEVHPEAISLLTKLGYDVSNLRSKSWTEFARPDSPHMDFIFTVCDDAAGETCPVWPGHPISAHWGVPDPVTNHGSHAEIGAVFADTYHYLHTRISVFVSLPFEALDKISLHDELHGIGGLEGATNRAKATSSRPEAVE